MSLEQPAEERQKNLYFFTYYFTVMEDRLVEKTSVFDNSVYDSSGIDNSYLKMNDRKVSPINDKFENENISSLNPLHKKWIFSGPHIVECLK